MSKTRFSVSMDDENVDWIDANYNNRSAFLNDLVTDFREGTSKSENVVAQYRLQQLEAEQASLQSQLETIQEQKNAIKDTVTTKDERRAELVTEAAETINAPADPENPAMQNWADKADMDPEEFADAYAEARHE